MRENLFPLYFPQEKKQTLENPTKEDASSKREKAEQCGNCVQQQNNSEALFFTTFSRKLILESKVAFPMVSFLVFTDSLDGMKTRQSRGNARNHRENTTVVNFHFAAEGS